MLTAKLVSSPGELDQIAALSQANHRSNVSEETKANEGFITWMYDAKDLQALHAVTPSVIVTDQEVLAGYALTLTADSISAYPSMAHSFGHISRVAYEGKPIGGYRFYLMGQICVAPEYRGKGVFDLLYQFHREQFSPEYDLLTTEISSSNHRSLSAHRRVGFEVIDRYRDHEDEWDVVVWDWRIL